MKKDTSFHVRMPREVLKRIDNARLNDPRCFTKSAWILTTLVETLDKLEKKKEK